MNIPDEAVQAAQATYMTFGIDDEMMREALKAALPFLQGVKVKALTWKEYEGEQGTSDSWDAVTGTGDYYFIGLRSDGYTLSFDYSDIGTFNNLEAAKAAAQAGYEARILSAIEPAPSPRAQALEEAVTCKDFLQVQEDVNPAIERLTKFSESAVSGICIVSEVLNAYPNKTSNRQWQRLVIRQLANDISLILAVVKEYLTTLALSSQPVAGGWLDMASAPRDGTKFDVWMMPYGYREPDVYWSNIQETWCRDGGCLEELNTLSPRPYPTHWRPLPAAPSEGAE